MELGARLRQARLEAGMSQRQLCGDALTRNMLSQIENGSANPSVETILYFARRLGKPVSYFLEEQPEESSNQITLRKMRAAPAAEVLTLLEEYEGPDGLLDAERYYLEVRACMELAQQAVDTGRLRYAAELLAQAQQAGEKTPYYTPDTRRQLLLLCHRAKAMPVQQIVQQLPKLDEELLLRAQAALESGDGERCRALLEAAQERGCRWHFYMGSALLQGKDFEGAARCLQKAEDYDRQKTYALLEQCYSCMEDYRQAYDYACKLRELEKGNTIFFASRDV